MKAEELIEPLEDLRSMERMTTAFIRDVSREILVSTALFSWLPKVKLNLRSALRKGVSVRVLMQLKHCQVMKGLRDLRGGGAEIRDTRDPWHPVRGTLVDNGNPVFLIWAAEETERHWNPIVYTPHHSKNPGLIRIFRESLDLRWTNARRNLTPRLAIE